MFNSKNKPTKAFIYSFCYKLFIMRNIEIVTIEEIEQLLLIACKTALLIVFVEEHSGHMVYSPNKITISENDDLGKIKNEITRKLIGKGINPNKERINGLIKLVSENSDNFKNRID